MHNLIPNVYTSMDVAPQREGWKSYKVNIHDFAAIDATEGNFFWTPEFSCNGHRWGLKIYPGGHGTDNGCFSIYLARRSKEGILATFEMKIFNKFGDVVGGKQMTYFYPPGDTKAPGWISYCRRSDILDLSKNILH